MIALIGDRPDIADEIRRHYRWFTVDEYQDITPAQDRLLTGWLGERDDVCVVGDASQTIYSFAGASPDALAQFARRWPNATEVRLDRCYRCTPEIVTVANSVMRSAAAARPEARWIHSPIRRRRAASPLRRPRRRPSCCAPSAKRPGAGDRAVRRRRRGGHDGGHPDHRADRTRGRRPRHRGPDADQRGVGADRGRAGRGEHPATSCAAPSGSSTGPRSARRSCGCVGRPWPGASRWGGSSDTDADGLVEQTAAVLAGMGWLSTGPASGGATRERWESLAAVLALAEEVAASGRSTMPDLVAEFERRAQMSHAPTADGVTVMTLHSAKGLEWPVVFIVGRLRGHPADRVRRHPGAGRGGTSAVLRRRDPRPRSARRHLGADPPRVRAAPRTQQIPGRRAGPRRSERRPVSRPDWSAGAVRVLPRSSADAPPAGAGSAARG